MKLSQILGGLFNSRPRPPAPTVRQNTRKTKAIWLLIRQGHITLREIANMGDNSPSKTIVRMRQDGVLLAVAFDPKGFRMAPNPSGQGQHKVYLERTSFRSGWSAASNLGEPDVQVLDGTDDPHHLMARRWAEHSSWYPTLQVHPT
ncbi:hypothetical protein X756_04410 [Mesorhizobium sp. LSHC412B00]|nr:hypothetical protein X756_04410 [Mesorhizobium sp. LSHC412B00]